jgi:hypothetical protein
MPADLWAFARERNGPSTSRTTPIIIPAAATSPGRRPPVRITAEIAFIGCTGSGRP